MKLVLSNSRFGMLSVGDINSSSGDFELPGVMAYPIAINSGVSIALPIRFRPSGFDPISATIAVFSNDPEGLWSGLRAYRNRLLVSIMADHGHFGDVCLKSFRDLVLTLNNSGLPLASAI